MNQKNCTPVPSDSAVREMISHSSLQNCRFLAHAANQDFYETTHNDSEQVWHRKVVENTDECLKAKEIETLTRLHHEHIVQVLGSCKLPGTLVWPLARYHLATLLEDVEACRNKLENREDSINITDIRPVLNRLHVLLSSCPGYAETAGSTAEEGALERIYSAALARVARCYGCILSAVSYLHGQRIYDNGLNPEKILLSFSRLWLTDFTIYSKPVELNMSAIDNRMWAAGNYIAPVISSSCPSGPSTDIYSLGCIFFEMTALCARIPFSNLSILRITGNPLSQAHVEFLEKCCVQSKTTSSARLRHLLCEIREMLHFQPEVRPTAADLLISIHVISRLDPENAPLYGACCAPSAATFCDHLTEMDRLRSEIVGLKNLLHARSELAVSQLQVNQIDSREWETENERLTQEVIVLKNLAATRHSYDSAHYT